MHVMPEEHRGPAYEGCEQRVKSIRLNLHVVTNIHAFLLSEVTAGRARIGFHGLGDQASVLHRLDQIGIRKSFFKNLRQFLRDSIAVNLSAFRSVIDLICVHGVLNGKEIFWNGVGQRSDAQLQFRSEVLFEIAQAGQCAEMLKRLRNDLGHTDEPSR